MVNCFFKFTWMVRLARTELARGEESGRNSFLGLLQALDDLMDTKCLLQWFSPGSRPASPGATAMSADIFVVKSRTERTAIGIC